MYFSSAKPLPKNDFLSVYKEAVLLTQLLFAPFGLSETAVDILGEQNAVQLYTSVFQQFEDLVSKRVFSIRGFDDDKIIASMHEFVGENQDQEVVQAMQAATSALQQMLVGPKVVEFDFSQLKSLPADYNVASARTTALLLKQVLTALVPTLYGPHYVFQEGEYHCEQPEGVEWDPDCVRLFTLDSHTLAKCQVRVPLAAFSPTCSFSRAPFNKISLRCKDSVSSMLSALTLSVAQLTATGNGDQSENIANGEQAENVVFSLQQYHSLLDLYGDSEEVKEVLQQFTRSPEPTTSIADVRNSLALNSLNLSANPSVSYINQLVTRLRALQALSTEEENEAEEEVTLGEVELLTDCFELAALSIERRHAAAQCALAEDFTQAVSLLTEGLLDLFDSEEDEEESEEEDFLLPGHIKVYLWTERATYLLESGDAEAALRDVNRAITLNDQYAPAYSLRSKLRMQELAQQEADELEELQQGAAPAVVDDEEKVQALHNAAEDALLAFLLDGSSDLALAAAAEEAAREACRLSAKNIFRDRKGKGGSIRGESEGLEESGANENAVSGGENAKNVSALRKDNLPRSWLVGSYFGAYTQLSTALSLYTTPVHTPEADEVVKADSSGETHGSAEEVLVEEESDNLCDIDEDIVDLSLPAVPVHLQSAKDAHNALNKDKEGYSLLLSLVELMESVTYDSTVNAQSSNVPATGITTSPNEMAPVEVVVIDRISHVHQRDVTHVSVSTQQSKVVRSVAASLLIFAEKGGLDTLARAMAAVDTAVPLVEGALQLVEEGVCGTESTALTNTTLTSTADEASSSSAENAATTAEHSGGTEVRVEACRHYRTALSLLRGSGWSSLGAESSVNLSEHARAVMGGLDSDAVYALTGVRFHADGSIAEIQSGPESPVRTGLQNEEASVSSTESESEEDSEQDYDDEGEDHGYGHGGFSFQFGGGEEYEDYDDEDEDEEEDEEEGSEEEGSDGEGDENEGSDWETVGSSEEASEAEGSEEEEETPAPAPKKTTKATKPSATTPTSNVQRGKVPSFAQAFKAKLRKQQTQEQSKTHNQGVKKNNTAQKDSREEEVSGALREIEAQLQRHHLEPHLADPVVPAAHSEVEEEVENDVEKEVEPASVPVAEHSEVSPLPTVTAATTTTNPIEESVLVERADTDSTEVAAETPVVPVSTTDFAHHTEQGENAAVVENEVVENSVVEQVPETETTTTVIPVIIDLSYALRARLLNLCGSVAYLAGDAVGAVQCFRASLQFDSALLDSQVKLGSLLVDMDEMKEAAKLLKSAHKKAPTDYIALLHLAEMHTHDNNFDEAVHLLRKARRLAETDMDTSGGNSSGGYGNSASTSTSANLADTAAATARAALLTGADAVSSSGASAVQAHIGEFHRRARQSRTESLANIISLLGINLFRQLPARPEVSLQVLQSALSEQFVDAHCPILLLCCGEVYSQAGDMVKALECFRKAHSLAPNNPLCYVNAARTYQQLNQVGTAERHLQAALLLDPAMAMVRVDLAQNLLLSGHAAQALVILDEALYLARQVSEIRDVLTARTIAAMQVSLEERGLYCSSGARSINN